MSKSLRIYKPKDFKEATTDIEKLYMHIIQPADFPLNDYLVRKLERLKVIYTVLEDSQTKQIAFKRLRERYRDEDRWNIYRYIQEAETLFGQILKTNRDFERARVLEKAWLLYEKAVNEWEDGRTAAMALAQVIKAQRLDQPDSEENLFEQLQLPAVELTRNPKALQAEDAVVIDDENEENEKQ